MSLEFSEYVCFNILVRNFPDIQEGYRRSWNCTWYSKKERKPDMAQMDKTQRNAIKQTFKNYRNMTSDVRRTLASIGIQAEKRKKHWILRYGNKIFICPSSASDHRSGMNLALEICRTLSEVQEKETKTFDNEQLLATH